MRWRCWYAAMYPIGWLRWALEGVDRVTEWFDCRLMLLESVCDERAGGIHRQIELIERREQREANPPTSWWAWVFDRLVSR